MKALIFLILFMPSIALAQRYPGGGIPIYASSSVFPAISFNGAQAVAADTDTIYIYNSGSMSWLPVTNPGVVFSIAAFGSSPNANGGSISSNTLTLQPASASFPGGVSTGTQSFAGNKTFTGTIAASNLSGTNTGDVTIGTANGLSLVNQVISLALASTSTTGALSSTDWNTFNGKGSGTVTSVGLTVPAFLSVSGSPVSGSGTLAVSFSGTALPAANGGTGVTSLGNLTDAGTDGIVVTGGTGALITSASLAQHVADSTHNGYLSSTDWSTFNGKQASGSYITALTGGVTASGPGSAVATVVTNANLTGVITSVGNATSIASQTGTGTKFVVDTSPTLVTPNIGAATGTSLSVSGQLTSTVATGTAPLAVSSTTQVANLNAATAGSATTSTTATNIAGGSGGSIPYQSAAATTAMLANGSAGQYLKSAGGTSPPTWSAVDLASSSVTGVLPVANGGTGNTLLPGAYFYNAYYPNSSSNYWSNANTSFGDFSVTGTIPSPTVLITSNAGSVSKATSSLPGINFSAPKTGTIKMTAVVSILPGQNAGATSWALKLHESTTSTDMAFASGATTANSSTNGEWVVTLVGYFNATSATTYNFKIQSLISSGTLFIGAVSVGSSSCLSFAWDYIN